MRDLKDKAINLVLNIKSNWDKIREQRLKSGKKSENEERRRRTGGSGAAAANVRAGAGWARWLRPAQSELLCTVCTTKPSTK